MKTPNFLFLNVFLVLLGGCAGLSPPNVESEAVFTLKGKLGVRTTDEGFSANIKWVQYENRFQITLWGALGQGRTEIYGSDGRIRIVDSKGQKLEGGNAEELMIARLGWSLPLDVLKFWVQGRVADQHPTAEAGRNHNNRLTQLRQLGWLIDFGWSDDAEDTDFPHKLIAERGASKITLVVKESERPDR